MKRVLLLALVLLAIPTAVLAAHAWASFHWPSDSLSPTVKDRTKSSLYDVPAAVAEWSAGPSISPVSSNKKGAITVKEASSTFWLVLARIFIDEDGHITKGEVLLNTRLLASLGPAAADHVLCQELGHVLGLNHNRDSLNTCMNDTFDFLGSATSPDAHDFEQLALIYNHADETAADDDNGGNGNNGRGGRNRAGHWVTVDIFPIP